MSLASKPSLKCEPLPHSPTPMDLLGKVIHLSGAHGETSLSVDRFYIPVGVEGGARSVEYLAITLTLQMGVHAAIRTNVESGCLSSSSFGGHHFIPGVVGSIG
jgi:hypothetical protein